MDPYKVFQYGDKIVEIHHDETAEDPRQNMDHCGILWMWHRRYLLGDKDEVKRGGAHYNKTLIDPADYAGWDELEEAFHKTYRPVALKPVYLYDHSGQTISCKEFSCRWDSGQVGLIWFPRESLKEIGYKIATKKARAKAEACIIAEVELQDHYIRGDVFGWELRPLVNGVPGDVEESCWGYYGASEIPYMLETALGSAAAAGAAVELSELDAEKLRAA